MRLITTFVGALVLAALSVVPTVRADELNRLTYMTFSGPVEVPGVTLAAGTYEFRLADLEGNRHIVQIFSRGDRKLITTTMTIPFQRLDPVKDTTVMFAERAAGSPQAVKIWFYPGMSNGEEFVYPRSQALAIARANHESVLSTSARNAEELKSSKVERVDENGQAARAESKASSNPTTTADANQPTTTARSTAGQTTTANTGRRTLPATASPLPFVGLLSALSLLGGFGVRRLRHSLGR
jgi:hypothetical protein